MRNVLALLGSLAAFAVLFVSPLLARDYAGGDGVQVLVEELITAAGSDEDEAAWAARIGEATVAAVPEARRAESLTTLRDHLKDAKVTAGTVVDDRATAHMTLAARDGATHKAQVLLRRAGEAWRLDAPYVYVIAGPSLTAANGKKAEAIKLSIRRSNGEYGKTAYAFRYASGDALACKNRVDIWACHNDDFHTSSDGSIVDLGAKSLRAVTEIPVTNTWADTAAIEPGHVYVVHCRDKRHADFFAKVRVKSFRGGKVSLEWSLLSQGYGAPADIHQATPPTDNGGANGYDGLCGRNAR